MVKWFSFDNTNAPQLTNAWGCLIDVLDACLITGFGSQTISNLVVSNGVATATFGTSHNFKQFQVVEVSGATQTVLNGEFKIIGLTSTTIEFLVSCLDLTATGTISAKVASLGWTKPFSDTQKAVYRAKDISLNPYFLRVDNSLDPVYNTNYAKFAKVGILETCNSIDDLSGNQAPLDPNNTTKNWIGTGSGGSASVGWAKWFYATSDSTVSLSWADSSAPIGGNRSWILIGDEANFYLLPSVSSSLSTSPNKDCSTCYGFGSFNSQLPYLLAYLNYNNVGYTRYSGANSSLHASNTNFLILLKNIAGNYTNNEPGKIHFGIISSSGFSGYTDIFEKQPDQNALFCPFIALDPSNYVLGSLPFAKCVLSATPSSEPAYFLFEENGNAFLKRRFIGSSLRYGSLIFDLGEMI